MNNIQSIEKWILDDCKCNVCKKDNYLSELLQSITIKKENTIQLSELTLTSKMIIKIQTEIMKKHLLDHASCEGVASFARSIWLISQTTKLKDGSHYMWDKFPISIVMDHYSSEQLGSEVIRRISRTDPWRTMWYAGKKNIDIFGKPAYQLTKDQLALCSYSSMYDNVHENPEAPDEKVIEDDTIDVLRSENEPVPDTSILSIYPFTPA